jgi:tRNA (mo5U34)-methyltransferase
LSRAAHVESAGASAELAQQVSEVVWYHTIELPGGLLTPGYVDNRALAGRMPFPSLAGKRCLDVGTMNGFWAFELERRGAQEVVTIDVADLHELDWPARLRLRDPAESYINTEDRLHAIRGFELAKAALGSRAQRREINVYDLSPEAIGSFDFVFVGSILLHLRDPVRALERIREVCSGAALIFEAIDLTGTMLSPRAPRAMLDGTRAWWWIPNARALRRMIESAGWNVLESSGIVFQPAGAGFRKLSLGSSLRAGPGAMIARVAGFPHMGWHVEPIG